MTYAEARASMLAALSNYAAVSLLNKGKLYPYHREQMKEFLTEASQWAAIAAILKD